MRYCEKCGTRLGESARYCGQCGQAAVTGVETAPPGESLPSPPAASGVAARYPRWTCQFCGGPLSNRLDRQPLVTGILLLIAGMVAIGGATGHPSVGFLYLIAAIAFVVTGVATLIRTRLDETCRDCGAVQPRRQAPRRGLTIPHGARGAEA